MRDPVEVSEIAYDLLRLRFEPRRDIATTIAQFWAAEEPEKLARALRKSCVYVARYLRQPITWVESLSVDELNRWGDVLAELLIEERGGSVDNDGPLGPMGLSLGDD